MNEKIKFYTVDELAEILQVHYQRVYAMLRKGEIPALRIGKLFRVMETDFNEYLKNCRTVKSSKVYPIACSVCGRKYYSALSITSECAVCGAPICKYCDEHDHVKYCTEHKDGVVPAAEAKPAKVSKPKKSGKAPAKKKN